MATLKVGDEFSSFASLNKAVTNFEKANFVSLYVRSSRTIAAATKRAPNKKYNGQLKFSELDYACVHGGRKCISRSNGKRPNQSTLLKNCSFMVNFRTTSDGQKLFLRSMINEHNHEVTEENFNHLAKQRLQFDDDLKKQAGQMMMMKSNKRLVQDHIRSITGKNVLLKDLENLAAKHKPSKKNDFAKLVEEMKKYEGAAVEVEVNQENVFESIYFQTQEMKRTFEAYPELLLIAAKCELNDPSMALYVLMVVDGNGESEIVCFWIMTSEDRLTVSKMLESFVKHNPNWEAVRCVMGDKVMTERDLLKEQLPEADLNICSFHVVKTMRCEVTVDKLGISVAERNAALEILLKIVHAENEHLYSELVSQLKKSAPKSVYNYFVKDWHPIRREWVEGFKQKTCNFLNRTNNRLESINQKLKNVVSCHSGMTVLFQDLMKCVASMKLERDHRAVTTVLKNPMSRASNNDAVLFQNLLTPYAYRYVEEQLKKSTDYVVVENVTGKAVKKPGEKAVVATLNNCFCGFFSSMMLPCCHIFAMRREGAVSLFDQDLVNERWTRESYKRNHRVFKNNAAVVTTSEVGISLEASSPQQHYLSELEKYKLALRHLEPLAHCLSHFSTQQFQENLLIIKQLTTSWTEGRTIEIRAVDQIANAGSDKLPDNDVNSETITSNDVTQVHLSSSQAPNTDESRGSRDIASASTVLDNDINIVGNSSQGTPATAGSTTEVMLTM